MIDETMSCHEEAIELQKQLDAINLELGSREDYESEAYSRMLEELAALTGRFPRILICLPRR
ncbi:MAG: hypothetical protein IPP49_20100 [Saprospiraceae bacterium]|nr:hypothetical protein [Saprospiraceae bacterium]